MTSRPRSSRRIRRTPAQATARLVIIGITVALAPLGLVSFVWSVPSVGLILIAIAGLLGLTHVLFDVRLESFLSHIHEITGLPEAAVGTIILVGAIGARIVAIMRWLWPLPPSP